VDPLQIILDGVCNCPLEVRSTMAPWGVFDTRCRTTGCMYAAVNRHRYEMCATEWPRLENANSSCPAWAAIGCTLQHSRRCASQKPIRSTYGGRLQAQLRAR
jgi:hypothetical protein